MKPLALSVGAMLLCVALAHGGSVTATNTPVDLQAYNEIMAERVLSPGELSDWFHDSQFRWWPLVPPDPEFFLRFESGDMLPFDPAKFPSSFVRGLWPHALLSVAAYDVTVVEDTATRNLIVYNQLDQPILIIPPEPGYGDDDFAPRSPVVKGWLVG